MLDENLIAYFIVTALACHNTRTNWGLAPPKCKLNSCLARVCPTKSWDLLKNWCYLAISQTQCFTFEITGCAGVTATPM